MRHTSATEHDDGRQHGAGVAPADQPITRNGGETVSDGTCRTRRSLSSSPRVSGSLRGRSGLVTIAPIFYPPSAHRTRRPHPVAAGRRGRRPRNEPAARAATGSSCSWGRTHRAHARSHPVPRSLQPGQGFRHGVQGLLVRKPHAGRLAVLGDQRDRAGVFVPGDLD